MDKQEFFYNPFNFQTDLSEKNPNKMKQNLDVLSQIEEESHILDETEKDLTGKQLKIHHDAFVETSHYSSELAHMKDEQCFPWLNNITGRLQPDWYYFN